MTLIPPYPEYFSNSSGLKLFVITAFIACKLSIVLIPLPCYLAGVKRVRPSNQNLFSPAVVKIKCFLPIAICYLVFF